MAIDTVAAKNRIAVRWYAALAVSFSLHVAVVVYAVTAPGARRDEPTVPPVVLTVLPEEAAPRPVAAPAGAVAAALTKVAPGHPGKPAGRPRSDRVVDRPASPLLAPPAEPTVVEAPAAAEMPNLQGDLIVRAGSAPAHDGAGVAGGVAPAAPGSETGGAPRILPPAEGNGQLAIDPNEARYQPVIPAPLRKSGARFAPFVKLCVRKDGSVGDVTIMRPSDPTVDPAIVEKIRLFKFRPYLDHGRPIPFCFFREYRLSIEE